MFQGIAGFALCVHDDQIGCSCARRSLREHIGRQRGDEVEVVFKQPDAQRA